MTFNHESEYALESDFLEDIAHGTLLMSVVREYQRMTTSDWNWLEERIDEVRKGVHEAYQEVLIGISESTADDFALCALTAGRLINASAAKTDEAEFARLAAACEVEESANWLWSAVYLLDEAEPLAIHRKLQMFYRFVDQKLLNEIPYPTNGAT